MSQAGWYPDHEDATRLRYHDGQAWTEHTHAAEAQAVQDTPEPVSPKQESLATKILSISVFGLFIGLLFGGFLFNGAGAITPVTEVSGTVDQLDIEYNQTSGAETRRSYALSGTTSTGEAWKIYDEDAYNTLQAQGYPQQVIVAIGDWTDTAERVTGESFEVNQQSTGGRIGLAAVLAFIALVALGTAFYLVRSPSYGPLVAIAFLVMLFGPGSWLGWQAFQWVQSG